MGLTKLEQLAVDHMARAHWSDRTSRTPGSTRRLLDGIEAKSPGALQRARDRYDKEREDSRFEGKVPAWAKRYVLKHAPSDTTLKIRISRTKPYTSGHCSYWNHRLVVTFGGTDEKEHRYVVLHEIAHTMSRGTHTEEFYDVLYRLLKAEGLYRYAVGKGTYHWGSSGLRQAARRERKSA